MKLFYKNNTPVLVYCSDEEKYNFIENNFKDSIYTMNFGNADIDDEEYYRIMRIIENLSDSDLSYIFYNMVYYGMYCLSDKKIKSEAKEAISEPSSVVYTKKDCVALFADTCCVTDKNCEVYTSDLFEAFTNWAKLNFKMDIDENYKAHFSRAISSKTKLKSEALNHRRNDGRKGYKGLGLKENYIDLTPSEIQLASLTPAPQNTSSSSPTTSKGIEKVIEKIASSVPLFS